KYPNQLVRVISRLNPWLNATTEIEATNMDIEDVPRAAVRTIISTDDKETAAVQHNQLLSTLDRDSFVMYTDGSLLHGKVGTGVYAPAGTHWMELRKSIGMGETAEVLDAELAGIRTACSYLSLLLHRNIPFQNAWIFLDNTSAIRRITSLRTGPGQGVAIRVHHLTQRLQELGKTLTIAWVPGHTD